MKDAARAEVEAHLDELIDLSHRIHAHPETAFEEHRSSRWTASVLSDAGFDVRAGVCDLETAFVAQRGSGDLVVAICAEYDALPEVGHACGHNIIAASAVGAGLALASGGRRVGLTVLVSGTPAEEGGGGKVVMLERGAFDGVHAGDDGPPLAEERLTRPASPCRTSTSTSRARRPTPRPPPGEGVNAPDAMTVAQVAIGLLRQQFRPGDQAHGVVTSRRGGRPTSIPSHVTGRFMWRARTARGPRAPRAPRRGAASRPGPWRPEPTVEVPELVARLQPHGDRRGAARRLPGATPRLSAATSSSTTRGLRCPTISTDMANVSLVAPDHPPADRRSSPAGRSTTSRSSPTACVTASADAAVRDGAVAMAWTAIDAAPARPARATAGRSRARRPGLRRLSSASNPPPTVIIEHAVLDLAPDRVASFEAAFIQARPLIAGSPGFLGLRLRAVSSARSVPAVGRMGAPRGPHRGVPQLTRIPGMAAAAPSLLRTLPRGRALPRGGPRGLVAACRRRHCPGWYTPNTSRRTSETSPRVAMRRQRLLHRDQQVLGASGRGPHVVQGGIDRRLVPLRPDPPDPLHLGPLELGVDREDLGRLDRRSSTNRLTPTTTFSSSSTALA